MAKNNYFYSSKPEITWCYREIWWLKIIYKIIETDQSFEFDFSFVYLFILFGKFQYVKAFVKHIHLYFSTILNWMEKTLQNSLIYE